jgi:protease I
MANALILVENGYDELEFWYPRLRLIEAGHTVTIVGNEAGATYESKRGIPAKADAAFTDPTLSEAGALIIPGGLAPDRLRLHKEAVELVRSANDRGAAIAAICHAGSVLVSAGIVEGRRLTSFASIRDDLVAAGAQWVDEPIVVDANLITSRTPWDLPHFLPAILTALGPA